MNRKFTDEQAQVMIKPIKRYSVSLIVNEITMPYSHLSVLFERNTLTH